MTCTTLIAEPGSVRLQVVTTLEGITSLTEDGEALCFFGEWSRGSSYSALLARCGAVDLDDVSQATPRHEKAVVRQFHVRPRRVVSSCVELSAAVKERVSRQGGPALFPQLCFRPDTSPRLGQSSSAAWGAVNRQHAT